MTSLLAYCLSTVAVAVLQCLLAHEAIVCRGYPPITEAAIWKFTFAPFLVFLPAIFGTRNTRIRGLVVLAFVTSFLFCLREAGQDAIPSAGHLFGFFGLTRRLYLGLIVGSLLLTPLAFLFLYLPERVLGDLWRMVWQHPVSHEPSNESLMNAFRIKGFAEPTAT